MPTVKGSDSWVALGSALFQSRRFYPALRAFSRATTALRAERAPVEDIAKAIMYSAGVCFVLQKFGAAAALLRESLGLANNPLALKGLHLSQLRATERALMPEPTPPLLPGPNDDVNNLAWPELEDSSWIEHAFEAE